MKAGELILYQKQHFGSQVNGEALIPVSLLLVLSPVDSRVVGIIPDEIDFASAAPLFCAGSTVYGGLLAADVKKDQVVAIIGCGGLGHLGTS